MTYLIRHCQLLDRPGTVHVRLAGDRIAEIGPNLAETGNETVVNANGGLLLSGLHDHHIHLVSLAAALASVHCGPPGTNDAEALGDLLARENRHHERGWLRGIGYHPCVAGDLDRRWLDRHIPDRPVRLQHRGGRLWILNTCALEALGAMGAQSRTSLPEGVEFEGRYPTGRLYECDRWLRERLGSEFPCLQAASQQLASLGVTGITDTTPSNGPDEWAHFQRAQDEGRLLQKVRMMGGHSLADQPASPSLQAGEYKVHLLETQLPDFDSLVDAIRGAHEADRGVAFHCVTHTELVFALSCLKAAGTQPGDRIEHASVTLPEMLDQIAAMGLRVVSQPHFIYERGEQYLREVDPVDQPWLYRLRSFLDAGVPLAAGSDAPFGEANPWRSMQAAIDRRTADGHTVTGAEALTPELALALYTCEAANPGVSQRTLSPQANASLCLLESPWNAVRQNLATTRVAATWVDGVLTYSGS